MLGTRASSSGAGGGGGGGAPFTIGGLFAGGEKGAYYDFTAAATLAVNADGSGGSPAIGAACRWTADQSPNANHLRNTASAVTRRVNGVETAGINYGLFNMSGFGNWPAVPPPFEMIVCLEQIAFAGNDRDIVACGVWQMLQGPTSGKLRVFDSGYGAEVDAGIASECVIDSYCGPGGNSVSLNGGAMVAGGGGGQPLYELVLGSNSGGNNPTQIRFKRLLVVGRALTAAERAGAVAWAGA